MVNIQEEFARRVLAPDEENLKTFATLKSYVEAGGLDAFRDVLGAHTAMWHKVSGQLVKNNAAWAEQARNDTCQHYEFDTFIFPAIKELAKPRRGIQDAYDHIKSHSRPVHAEDSTVVCGLDTFSATQLTATQMIESMID